MRSSSTVSPASKSATNSVLILVTTDGYFLTVKHSKRRNFGTSTKGGKGFLYSFPGGNIDAGENSREAAARECKEETGIDTVGYTLKNITQSIDPAHRAKKTDYFLCRYSHDHITLSRQLSRSISGNTWGREEIKKPCVHSLEDFFSNDSDIKNYGIMQSIKKRSELLENPPSISRARSNSLFTPPRQNTKQPPERSVTLLIDRINMHLTLLKEPAIIHKQRKKDKIAVLECTVKCLQGLATLQELALVQQNSPDWSKALGESKVEKLVSEALVLLGPINHAGKHLSKRSFNGRAY